MGCTMKKLYFVAGPPTEAELEEAEREGALIRNALAWHEGDAFEECAQALGEKRNIPTPYRHLWKQRGEVAKTPAKKSGKAK